MGLIAYLILCAVVGVICYLLVRFVPMPAPFPTMIPMVAAIVLILILLLLLFGGLGVRDVQIPSLR